MAFGQGGDCIAAMLNFLERESSRRFFDAALGVNADISMISWMATANDLSSLPQPLLSRFTVIRVPLPSAEHVDQIVDGILQEMTTSPLPDAIAFLKAYAVKGPLSVRSLRRAMEAAVAVTPEVASSLH